MSAEDDDYEDSEWSTAGPPDDLSLFLKLPLPQLIQHQQDFLATLNRCETSDPTKAKNIKYTLNLIQEALNTRQN